MPFSRERFEVTQYLGNVVGSKDKFLQSIALMSNDWREIRACLEVVKILSDSGLEEMEISKDELKQLEVICKITEKLGQANFNMDVVSHLAMKIGKSYRTYDGE